MTLNDNTEECNHRPITSIITYLTMGHFILMALYNTFIRYKKHRLGYIVIMVMVMVMKRMVMVVMQEVLYYHLIGYPMLGGFTILQLDQMLKHYYYLVAFILFW